MTTLSIEDVKNKIRAVENFPKEGIIFRDITTDLEYGSDTIEIHADAIEPGANVLVVDDLLATGGTAKAACNLVRKAGGNLVGAAFLIELCALGGSQKLDNCGKVISMLKY